MVEIVFTGGGSGGHTSAAMGMIDALGDTGYPKSKLLWIGSRTGIEAKVAVRNGIAYRSISVGKLRRYWDRENLLDIPRVMTGVVQSIRLLAQTRPRVVVSTGGFVSVPVVLAARLLAIPILVHEQTLVPGLANRIGGYLAEKLILTFTESSAYFNNSKSVTIGNPLRKELRQPFLKREEALARLKFDPTLPLLYVTGGAQGASALNRLIGEILPELVKSWQVLHQFGTLPSEFNEDYLNKIAGSLPAELSQRYKMVPYIGDEIVEVYAGATLMLSRAGAGTVNEIIRLGMPAILVPLPNSADQEQQKMAAMLTRHEAAIVFSEAGLAGEDLLRCLQSLTPEAITRLGEQARSLTNASIEERLAQLILSKVTD